MAEPTIGEIWGLWPPAGYTLPEYQPPAPSKVPVAKKEPPKEALITPPSSRVVTPSEVVRTETVKIIQGSGGARPSVTGAAPSPIRPDPWEDALAQFPGILTRSEVSKGAPVPSVSPARSEPVKPAPVQSPLPSAPGSDGLELLSRLSNGGPVPSVSPARAEPVKPSPVQSPVPTATGSDELELLLRRLNGEPSVVPSKPKSGAEPAPRTEDAFTRAVEQAFGTSFGAPLKNPVPSPVPEIPATENARPFYDVPSVVTSKPVATPAARSEVSKVPEPPLPEIVVTRSEAVDPNARTDFGPYETQPVPPYQIFVDIWNQLPAPVNTAGGLPPNMPEPSNTDGTTPGAPSTPSETNWQTYLDNFSKVYEQIGDVLKTFDAQPGATQSPQTADPKPKPTTAAPQDQSWLWLLLVAAGVYYVSR